MKVENTDKIKSMSYPVYLFAKCYFFFRSLGKNLVFSYDFPKDKFKHSQVIVISDHASFWSQVNTLRGLDMPRSSHAVVGSTHLARPIEGKLLKLAHSIPMRKFVSDMPALMKMIRTVKEGHSLLLFPEGINSFCGMTHPVMPATITFLKQMEVDVVLAVSSGEYLATPRYNRDKKKGARVDVRLTHLFTKEELHNKSIEELEEKLFTYFKYNDFKWNDEKRYHYKGKLPNCTGIENVIYSCPKCKSDGTLYTSGDEIICKNCGNTIVMDDTYHIEPKTEHDYLPYHRVDEWYLEQRKSVRDSIKKDSDYTLQFDANLNVIASPKDRPRRIFKKIGEGIVTIDKSGTTYTGTEDGENVEIFIPIKRSFGAGNQDNKYLVLSDHEKTVAFEVTGGTPIVKAEVAIEEFHALMDPAWEKALRRAYYSDMDSAMRA